MSTEQETPLIFECAGDKLVGILHPGHDAATVGIVIVVGGPQYRVGSHRQFVQMARALAAAGYPVLRFDYRGMGDSCGRATSFDAVGEDIRSAVCTLIQAVPQVSTVVLLGLCDAASANLMYCGTDARVGGLVLLNPWVRTEQGEAKSYLKHYYAQRLLQRSFWRKVFAGEYDLRRSLSDFVGKISAARRRGAAVRGSAQPTQPAFIERMRKGFADFNRPALFLISGRDLTGQEFMQLCRNSKPWARCMRKPTVSTKLLPLADHTTSRIQDLQRACDETIAWLHQEFPHGGLDGGLGVAAGNAR